MKNPFHLHRVLAQRSFKLSGKNSVALLIKARQPISNDLGAFAGLLFEIGAKKIIIGEENFITEEDKVKFEKQVEKRRKEVESEQHT